MATPRSLRSFLDATPSELLDTPFRTLTFIPRSEHDALLAELASLRDELAEKQEHLRNLENKNHEENPVGGFLASIDAEVKRNQVAQLEQKNAALEREKQQLATATEEADAKARVLKSEVTRLRSQLQKQPKRDPAVDSAAAPSWQIEISALEGRNAVLQSDVTRLKAQLEEAGKELNELRSIVPEARELTENYNNLQTEKDSIAEDRWKLQDSLTRITETNTQLYEKTRQLDATIVALRKANEELMESNTRNQDECQKAISKYQDISDENSHLEKENNRLHKENVRLQTEKESLQTENNTLVENKTALEAEVKNLLEKLTGKRNPDAEEPYRADLKTRIDKLLKERDGLVSDRRRTNEQLRNRDQAVEDLRRDIRKQEDHRSQLLHDYRKLKDDNFNLTDNNTSLSKRLDESNKKLGEVTKKFDEANRKYEDLNRKYADASRNCTLLQDEVSKLQAGLTASQLVTKREPYSKPQIKNNTPGSSSEMSTNSLETPPPAPEPAPAPVPRALVEYPTGNSKRKAIESARAPANESIPPRSTTPSDKRQKLDPPAPRKRGAIYLVQAPTLVNRSLLYDALSKTLSTDIKELRRVFKTSPSGEDQWVVKLEGAPKEFVKHVQIPQTGLHATLLSPSGITCPICDEDDDREHDLMDCEFVGTLGQDRPTLRQLEIMNHRPPPMGLTVDTLPSPPKDEYSPRSLFDRVSFPDVRRPSAPERPLSRTNNESALSLSAIEDKVSHLLHLTRTERRRIFCRLVGSYIPRPDELLSEIGFGPVAAIRIVAQQKACFLDFVFPTDAERFLQYALRNPNKYTFRDPARESNSKCVVKFHWCNTAVDALDEYYIRGIIAESWTRVLILKRVLDTLTTEETMRLISKVCTVGRDALLFWINRSNPYLDQNGRHVKDVMIEFSSIKDAESAFRLFESKGYVGSVFWGVEDNVRALE